MACCLHGISIRKILQVTKLPNAPHHKLPTAYQLKETPLGVEDGGGGPVCILRCIALYMQEGSQSSGPLVVSNTLLSRPEYFETKHRVFRFWTIKESHGWRDPCQSNSRCCFCNYWNHVLLGVF